MIRTLLIANRGEIACRVIATARRMGLRTVAVYSDVDARAQHVAVADVAVRIGPAPASESYLNGPALIEAAKATGADAIHPGYGFLSENAAFVEAVEAAGLTFVGPPATAIKAMGLKDAAKALMAEAGVPVVPGYHGADQDPTRLAAQADAIGYPVMIKARAGGGGKGMRQVKRAQDFAAALEGAQREGQGSFGDGAVLIEKYIAQPRHIEVQIFADTHGNIVHLHERDCSLQRRHQKVIEEAPAPGVTPELRATLGEIAITAAHAVGYVGAGTVEFIVDGSGPLRAQSCWFMEMNTRLQVEHPVTEAITGLDLVEWQILVANGAVLPLQQSEIPLMGHAVEARVYAEDVSAGFLPATGQLEHVSFTQAVQFERAPVRVDCGVAKGDEISAWYDPMIAKVITHAPDRSAAFARLARALADTQIAGPCTNLPFLHRLVQHPDVMRGAVHTGLISEHSAELCAERAAPEVCVLVAALAGLGVLPAPALAGWRAWGEASYFCRFAQTDDLHIRPLGGDAFLFHESRYSVRASDGSGSVVAGLVNEALTSFQVVTHKKKITIFGDGEVYSFDLIDPLDMAVPSDAHSDDICAPMPGVVKALSSRVGTQVCAGDPLIVLEAMKMEHTLTAPRDGIIAEMPHALGVQVAAGAMMVRLEPKND